MIGAILATMSAGLGVASAIGNYNASKQQAKQLKKESNIKIQNRADEIRDLAAQQRVLYLSAGLELEGTPQTVIADTYNTGINDIKAIRDSYNIQIKNVKTQARANLLGGLALSATSLYSAFGANNAVSNDITADASEGAVSSSGSWMGISNGINKWNVSGTAGNGGNVRVVNGFYSG